jgi:hypothetical protein
VGWSCAVVAGSTLLSESVPEPTRPGVQGTADLAMNVCGALAGAGSGVGLAELGYGGLNAAAAVLVLPVLLLLLQGARGRAYGPFDLTGSGPICRPLLACRRSFEQVFV